MTTRIGFLKENLAIRTEETPKMLNTQAPNQEATKKERKRAKE